MSVQDQIIKDVNSNDVLLYMKGEPGNSSCGYSTRLVNILEYIGVDFATRDVLESDELRREVKTHTGMRTLPLLFVKGNYAGGSDSIRAMHEAGTLIPFFQDHDVSISIDSSKEPLVVDDISREQIIQCSKSS